MVRAMSDFASASRSSLRYSVSSASVATKHWPSYKALLLSPVSVVLDPKSMSYSSAAAPQPLRDPFTNEHLDK